MKRIRHFLCRLARRPDGAAAVEFVLILNLLLLLILGIMDFGHAWYLKQIVTNAGREGARYGVLFNSPKKTTTEIQTHVLNYLKDAGVKDAAAGDVTVTGAGGATGTPLTVAVRYNRSWWVINHFIPTLAEKAEISAQTVMRNE